MSAVILLEEITRYFHSYCYLVRGAEAYMKEDVIEPEVLLDALIESQNRLHDIIIEANKQIKSTV